MLHQTFPAKLDFDVSATDGAESWWGDIGDDWLRLNVITDAAGNFVDYKDSSDGLTGGVDRTLLKSLRKMADAVIIGASTVRAEPASIPRDKQLIIVSLSGEMLGQVLSKTELVPIVFSSEQLSLPGFVFHKIDDFSAESIISGAKAIGFKKLVCEGGPTIARLFEKAVSPVEWCQTISPSQGKPSSEKLETPSWPLIAEARDDAGFVYSRRSRFGAPATA